jgi:hypothetical protein
MSNFVKLGRLGSLCLLLLVAGNASAAIQKCKAASGEIIYTQIECPPGTTSVELADGVPENTGSSFRSSATNSRYSTRSSWLEKMDNRDLQMLYRECNGNRMRQLSQCADINGMWAERTAVLDRQAAIAREQKKALCEAGDASACEDFSCIQYKPTALANPYIPYAGTDTEVRGCSRDRRFPSSPQWAQIFETAEHGVFVCLPRLEIRNEIGELLAFRAVLKVGPNRSPGGTLREGFTTPAIKGKVFPTMSDALNTGCQTLITNAPDWHVPASKVAAKKI